jgi:flotillin
LILQCIYLYTYIAGFQYIIFADDDLTFFGFRFYVAKPNEFLAITGYGITDIEIQKKTMKLPFQRVFRLDITLRNYSFELHAMSKEKMEFLLPGVFTIGPKVCTDNDEETKSQVYKYALFLSGAAVDGDNLDTLIKGIIDGEVRVLAVSMSIE